MSGAPLRESSHAKAACVRRGFHATTGLVWSVARAETGTPFVVHIEVPALVTRCAYTSQFVLRKSFQATTAPLSVRAITGRSWVPAALEVVLIHRRLPLALTRRVKISEELTPSL